MISGYPPSLKLSVLVVFSNHKLKLVGKQHLVRADNAKKKVIELSSQID